MITKFNSTPLDIKFSFPISESVKEDSGHSQDFIIRGTAINETTTRNNHTFIAEELKKSASSLRGKPILKDHKNEVDSIVGKVTQNVFYDQMQKRVVFEAKILDKKMQEMITEGLIKDVSVGATIQDYDVDEETGSHILRGIEFVELSFVAVPADPNANFARADFAYAITESFNGLEKTKQKSEATKMEEIVKESVVPVQEKPSVDIAEFNRMKSKLDAIDAKEAREKLETEIRAKVEAEIKAKTETKVEEKPIPKAGIAKEEVKDGNSGYVIFESDSSTGDKRAFGMATYSEKFGNLSWRK